VVRLPPRRRAPQPLLWALHGLLLLSSVQAADEGTPEPRPAAAASAKTPSRIPRAAAPIEIDGKLDEAAWSAALVVELPYGSSSWARRPATRPR